MSEFLLAAMSNLFRLSLYNKGISPKTDYQDFTSFLEDFTLGKSIKAVLGFCLAGWAKVDGIKYSIRTEEPSGVQKS
jgi:hypothetical protein